MLLEAGKPPRKKAAKPETLHIQEPNDVGVSVVELEALRPNRGSSRGNAFRHLRILSPARGRDKSSWKIVVGPRLWLHGPYRASPDKRAPLGPSLD
jgi:hypothetical protein